MTETDTYYATTQPDEQIELEWVQELPPRSGGRFLADEYPHDVLAALAAAQRGGWVEVPGLPAATATAINRALLKAYRPAGAFAATARNGNVYLRCLRPEVVWTPPAHPGRSVKVAYVRQLPPLTRRGTRASRHFPVAQRLRERPGQWARLIDEPSFLAGKINCGQHPAYLPGGAFEAVARTSRVYVRYVGDVAENSHAA